MGILNRLLGRTSRKETSGDLSNQEAQVIVNAYGKALSSKKSGVADASELPYPKTRIKAALLAAIRAIPDASMRDQLKAGYVSLADWQDGVGTDALAFESAMKVSSGGPLQVAKRIAEAGPAYMEIQGRIVAEATKLAGDLKSAGL
jgi:hypothetical protein